MRRDALLPMCSRTSEPLVTKLPARRLTSLVSREMSPRSLTRDTYSARISTPSSSKFPSSRKRRQRILMRSSASANLTLTENARMTGRVRESAQPITNYPSFTTVPMSSLRLLRPENSISVAPPRPSRSLRPTLLPLRTNLPDSNKITRSVSATLREEARIVSFF